MGPHSSTPPRGLRQIDHRLRAQLRSIRRKPRHRRHRQMMPAPVRIRPALEHFDGLHEHVIEGDDVPQGRLLRPPARSPPESLPAVRQPAAPQEVGEAGRVARGIEVPRQHSRSAPLALGQLVEMGIPRTCPPRTSGALRMHDDHLQAHTVDDDLRRPAVRSRPIGIPRRSLMRSPDDAYVLERRAREQRDAVRPSGISMSNRTLRRSPN